MWADGYCVMRKQEVTLNLQLVFQFLKKANILCYVELENTFQNTTIIPCIASW